MVEQAFETVMLILNSGSSSVKFAVFTHDGATRMLSGGFERLGLPETALTLKIGSRREKKNIDAPDHAACLPLLLDLLKTELPQSRVGAVAHRIVHGGARFSEPERITPAMLDELRGLIALAPDHLAGELALIDAAAQAYPGVPQVACFDTCFHHTMPLVAQRLPIPRRYFAQGVRKFGFHGLSYSFLMDELRRVAGDDAANGRVILAHLGNGASMAAVKDGRCVDTTMSFTPAAGLVMSARSGDLDPGLVAYFARTEQMSPEAFDRMINKESGLLGISEISSDVRDLEAREASDPRAKDALDSFCYNARKWIGALSATLGGLDTLVFAGGIGENSTAMRARICENLNFLGIQLDGAGNAQHAPVISAAGAWVTVRVIKTDEEAWIARAATGVLKAT